MIKFDSNTKENRCALHVKGDMPTILAETMYMVAKIYDAMAEQNEDGAEKFKEVFLAMTADGFPFCIEAEEEEQDEEEEKLDRVIELLEMLL